MLNNPNSNILIYFLFLFYSSNSFWARRDVEVAAAGPGRARPPWAAVGPTATGWGCANRRVTGVMCGPQQKYMSGDPGT